MATLRDYFSSIFPEAALQDMLSLVYKGYKNTSLFMKTQDLQPGPSKNVYPYNRCANIDSNLLALNNKYYGLFATSEINYARNWHYTLLSFKNIRITMAAVDTPNNPPRESLFRNELASSQIGYTFNSEGNVVVKDLINNADSIIYALVIHSPAIDNPNIPAFIQVVFPNKNCTTYLDRIDLFKKFPDLVNSLVREGMEQIPDNAEVKLSIPNVITPEK